MNLDAFGQTLRKLRKKAGLTQRQLSQEIHVSPELISNWERAYQNRGRRWEPSRQVVVELAGFFAEQLNPQTAQQWLTEAGYRLSDSELYAIFDRKAIDFAKPSPFRPLFQANLKAMDISPEQNLYGVDTPYERLHQLLAQKDRPHLIAIDGPGGIGKTALAQAVLRAFARTDRFYDILWLSAKQEEFSAAGGIRDTNTPALDENALITELLRQLYRQIPLPNDIQAKRTLLIELAKEYPFLIVIDNLETVADYESVLPLLRLLANPGKVLLTSRHSLSGYADVFSLNLKELALADTIALLKYQAETRGLPALKQANQAQFEAIHNTVGGNPLALKLVVGLLRALPLWQILENLKQAQGKKAEELYSYLYWHSWQALAPVSKQALLIMPLIGTEGGAFDYLLQLSQLSAAELSDALEQLTMLSLVEANGHLETPRYRIHRLTETFLLNEVIECRS